MWLARVLPAKVVDVRADEALAFANAGVVVVGFDTALLVVARDTHKHVSR